MNRPKTQIEETQETGFPIRVTYRNRKTGLVEKKDPYILRIVGHERRTLWERPAGSGNLFDGKNKPAGRWDMTKKEGDRFLPDAEHIAVQVPETADQKLAHSVVAKDARIAELERELASIRKEKEAKEKKTDKV